MPVEEMKTIDEGQGIKLVENKVRADQKDKPEIEKRKSKRAHWAWPVGLAFAGIGTAAAILLRGCWHSNMSWPTRAEDEHGHYSYQVCMNCGVKRLFDERSFRGYGPYDYDLHELIARERLARRRRMEEAALTKPTPHVDEPVTRKDEE